MNRHLLLKPASFFGMPTKLTRKPVSRLRLSLIAYMRAHTHTLALWATSHESVVQGWSEKIGLEMLVNSITEIY